VASRGVAVMSAEVEALLLRLEPGGRARWWGLAPTADGRSWRVVERGAGTDGEIPRVWLVSLGVRAPEETDPELRLTERVEAYRARCRSATRRVAVTVTPLTTVSVEAWVERLPRPNVGIWPRGRLTGLRVPTSVRLTPEAVARAEAEARPGESLGDTISRLVMMAR
jgi:hypothetical protein